jgi:hypothetical protein
MYSYDDLKKAYLQKLHVLHPDKKRIISSSETMTPTDRKEFQELQDVWSQYDEMAKSMKKVAGGDGAAANFTMFGVGCSFSDNDAERALRKDITDQACRGWFSSGLLAENHHDQGRSSEEGATTTFKLTTTSLVDDSLFVESTDENDKKDDNASLRRKNLPRPTLIAGMK